MKIFYPDDPIPSLPACVVSVGNFDGLHNGHQFLIRTVCERARYHGVKAVVVTFEPHTRAFLYPEKTPPLLTNFDEKALLLRQFGVDYLVCLRFDQNLAGLSPSDFVETVLIGQLNAIEWVMGENHTFGKNRAGAQNFLHNSMSKNHFMMFTVRLHMENEAVASSTAIRTFIGERRIEEAVTMLGHPYLILAERIRGMRKGIELGYPTLNFKCPPSQKVIPPAGVYAAEVEFGEFRYCGALYYGNCPTYENRDFHFEFHSLEPLQCDPEIGSKAALWLWRHIRQEMSFASETLLVEHIKQDIDTIKRFFNKE